MRTRARLPLIGVLVVVVALVVGLVGVARGRADARPTLPSVSPQALLASTIRAAAQPHSISGDVTSEVDIGLPELPTDLGGGAAGPLAQLLGTQHYKVWRSPDGVRLAHITDFSEQVLVANHTDAWFWDSDGMRAVHLPAGDLRGDHAAWFAPGMAGGASQAGGAAALASADPSTLAGMALLALAPYATVSVDDTAVVAGRPAYELVLTPTGDETSIGRIAVAIDADTRVPLRFDVTAKSAADPSVRVGFTSVSFDAIDPATFTFTPPAGADVSTWSPGDHGANPGADGDHQAAGKHGRHPETRVFGSGFDTRVAVKLPHPLPGEVAALLPFSGPLFSVLTVDAGGSTWLLAGPVGLDTLREDARQLTS